MKWDPYSGDYGMGFYGHAVTAASYLVKDPVFGWLGFGGNVSQADGTVVTIAPKDSARSRLFVAPAGLWITLTAGKIAHAAYDTSSGAVTLTLDPASSTTLAARITLETTTPSGRSYTLPGGILERGEYTVALSPGATNVRLQPN
jgi:hypothetical protein